MLKTFFHSVMGSSLSHSLQTAVDTVNQWRSRPRHELIFDSGRREISQYLLAIDKLQVSNAGGSNDKLISTAMERLKAEFEAVLRRHADLQPGPLSTTEWSSVSDSTANAFRFEDYVPADAMSADVIDFLRNIAERMRSRGKIEECVRVYKNVRKPYLQSQLKRLRFDELRGDHNQRRYVHDELKVKMEQWIQVSKICVKILFEREKKVCDEIFGSGEVTEECFVGTVKDSAVLLFRFAEDLSSRKQPYDKMGAVLGVYEAFLWVLPSAEALFASAQGKGVRDVCDQAYSRIQSDAVRMLYDLEHDVLHEKIDNGVLEERGGVHPTTEIVVEQIQVVVRNKNVLATLITSPPSLNFGDATIPQEELRHYNNSNNGGFLAQHLVLIILVLLKNLERKARSYKVDPSLGHLFLMVNLRRVLKAVEGSDELQEMLGARLIGKMSDQLGSARASYQTTTCDKFLKCLRDDGIYITSCCFNSRPSKAAIKRRLNEFNSVFEGVKNLHASWKIPDNQLREEVRRHMSDVLVPPYRIFLDTFGNNPETRLIVEGTKRHSAEDLQALVQTQLFANTHF